MGTISGCRFRRVKLQRWLPSSLLALGVAWACEAQAAPGEAIRLSGVSAQGPSAISLSALHHNPAMLSSLPAFDVLFNAGAGVQQTGTRSYPRNGAGARIAGALGPREWVANPGVDGFFGASAHVDDLTIAAAVYSLGNRIRVNNGSQFPEHAVTDDRLDCGRAGERTCRQTTGLSGQHELRTDITLGVAWRMLPMLDIGAAMHFPFLTLRTSRNDLASNSGLDCPAGAGPTGSACHRRFVLDVRSKGRLSARDRDDASRIDFALTLGITVRPSPKWRIGARFRTPPLLERGVLKTFGDARSCSIDAQGQPGADCSEGDATPVVVEQVSPREAAIGVGFVVGRRQDWIFDTNLFWIDHCPGRWREGTCVHESARTVAALGGHTGIPDPALHELTIYRGLRDVVGLELWGRHILRRVGQEPTSGPGKATGFDLRMGLAGTTPGVVAGATTIAQPELWRLSISMGAGIQLPIRSTVLAFVPGYAIDLGLPATIGNDRRHSVFDPHARQQFELADADIDRPAADPVLEGRARASNAGRYFALDHTFTLSLRWTQRLP